MTEMTPPRNLDEVFASFETTWEPRIVARVNDYDVRVARCEGAHTWHSHADTDDLVLGTHWEPCAGYVRSDGDVWRVEPAR